MHRFRQRLPLLVSLSVLAAATGQDPHWFDAPMIDGTPGRIYALLGDLDLDGDDDIVAFTSAGFTATSFTPLINDGSGRFAAGTPVPLPAGSLAGGALLDVGGDGRLDVVVVGNGTGNTGLNIYQSLPSGTFAAPNWFALPGTVTKIAVGTANGDALGDLFVQTLTANATAIESRWLFGDPGHTFLAGPLANLPFLPGSIFSSPFPLPLIVIDVDGDQIDDLVVAAVSGGASVLAPFLTTPTGTQPRPLVPVSTHVGSDLPATTIDVDQDGDLDIVLNGHSGQNSRLSVVTNQAGVFTETTTLSMPVNNVGQLFACDWDNDGRDDLVMRRGSNSSPTTHRCRWLRSTGPGTFELIAEWLDLPDVESSRAVGCADIDGDGNVDLVDGRAVVFGRGSFVIGFADAGDRMVDWDGDGDLDALRGNYRWLWKNDGRELEAATTLSFPPPPPGFLVSQWNDLGDLDGDGLRELNAWFVQSPPVPFGFEEHLLRETGDGAFVDAGLSGLPLGAAAIGRSPVVQDFEGDGDLDVLGFEQVYLNDGTATFTPAGVSFGSRLMALMSADLDGDTDLDLLCYNTQLRGLTVSRRTGPTSFAPIDLYSGALVLPALDIDGLLLDLDDDGDLDVAGVRALTATDRQVLVFANNGGLFTQAAALPFDGPIAAGDIDGDGRTDLCVSSDGFLTVLQRTGPGFTYASPVVFAAPPARTLVDFDQDGDLDAAGVSLVTGRRFVSPDSGYRRQYGLGSAGAGGIRPLLSATGTLRPGFAPAIELSRVPGGTFAFLLVGQSEANAPSVVLPGVFDYVGSIRSILAFATGGAPGAGQGRVTVPLTLTASTAGARVYTEALVLDPASPFALTYSNGLEVTVGL